MGHRVVQERYLVLPSNQVEYMQLLAAQTLLVMPAHALASLDEQGRFGVPTKNKSIQAQVTVSLTVGISYLSCRARLHAEMGFLQGAD
jgi:hypothetical protein